VYELMTYFAAYTGLRAEELAGLEVGDLVFQPEGTERMAAGDYSQRLPVVQDDDLGAVSPRVS
jgi:integrase